MPAKKTAAAVATLRRSKRGCKPAPKYDAEEDTSDTESVEVVSARAPKRSKTAKQEEEVVVLDTNVGDTMGQLEELLSLKKPDHAEGVFLKSVNAGIKCDPSQLSAGSLLYRPARLVLKGDTLLHQDCLEVRNQDLYSSKSTQSQADWSLHKNLIAQQCWTPDQYTKVEKVTATDMAYKLKHDVGDSVCKVEFTKTPDASEMGELIRKGSQLIEASSLTEEQKKRQYKKLFERSQKGEYRVMRGYIIRKEGDMHAVESDTGFVRFLDADLYANGTFAERQVNPRSVMSLTYRLTRFELK